MTCTWQLSLSPRHCLDRSTGPMRIALDQMRLRSNARMSNWVEPVAFPAAVALPRRRRTTRNKNAMVCLMSISALTFLLVVKKRHHYIQSKRNDLRLGGSLKRCDLSTYPLSKLSALKDLDLSGCYGDLNLPDEPSLWASFSSLKKLDLNNNQLNTLPQSMSHLPSLEILFLSENEFVAIPEVRKMNKLRVLSLRGNLVTNLSTIHLPIATLEWLILTNNHIQKIESDIKNLTHLKKLMLSHNNLTEIPHELGDCQNLELIRLADNNIRYVPKSLLSLSKLAWISISGNPFSDVLSASTSKQDAKIIAENELEINDSELLGSGASGKVYKGIYQGNDVAVKIFKAMSKGSDGNSEDEANINSLIDTPYAISALGVIPASEGEGKYKGMVMTLLDGTYPMGIVPSFQTVTRDEAAAPHATNLSTQQVMSTIWNIASALEYIHARGICHGDVYLHNILRDGEGVARLSDWGASFVYDRTNVEVASKVEKIEVLAFGRLVQDLFSWHLNAVVPDSTESASYSNNIRSGSKTISLIASILQPDQSKRPTFREIKEILSSIPEFEPFRIPPIA